VGISEWDSLEQVQAYLNSEARKKVVGDGKVVKINRQYIVEAGN
jgi:heme-degrading monooxygenase HmoA